MSIVSRNVLNSSNRYDADNEISEAEDALSNQTDGSNVITDRSMFKSCSLINKQPYMNRTKQDAKKIEYGGLSDFLLSMTSSSVHKVEQNAGIDPGFSSFPHHTKSYN